MLDFIMHAFQVVTAQTLNMSARMPALSKQTEKYYNKNIYPSVESTSEYNPYSSYFVFFGGILSLKRTLRITTHSWHFCTNSYYNRLFLIAGIFSPGQSGIKSQKVFLKSMVVLIWEAFNVTLKAFSFSFFFIAQVFSKACFPMTDIGHKVQSCMHGRSGLVLSHTFMQNSWSWWITYLCDVYICNRGSTLSHFPFFMKTYLKHSWATIACKSHKTSHISVPMLHSNYSALSVFVPH